MLRLLVLGLIMLPIIGAVMLAARVPDALAALGAVRRRLGRTPRVAGRPAAPPVRPRPRVPLTYPDQRNSLAPRGRRSPTAGWRGPPAPVAGAGMRKGPAVTDESAGDLAPLPDNGATTKMPRPAADDFQPDVPADAPAGVAAGGDAEQGDPGTMPVSTVSPADLGQAACRLRRRPHPRRAALRRAARAADRGGDLGRGRAPHPRRHHRRRSLPAAGVPRRTAEPAVLAGPGHRAGPAGRR